MNRTHFMGAAALVGLLLTGAGCISFGSSSAGTGADGGVFKTSNRGDAWLQKVAVPTVTGEKRTIGGVSVATIVQDPSDQNALYVGTNDNGMYYSYDGGESWQQPGQLSRGRVPSVAIDPRDKCTLYAAVENKLLKSEDCSRSWATTYLDARVDKLTSAVVVDFYNPLVVWVSNNSGDVLRSTDAGASWTNVKSFQSPVAKMMMSPADSRVLFVATKNDGVWRTGDGGANWTNLRELYKDFAGGNEFYDMAIGTSDANTVILATKHGLLRSKDSGAKWEAIPLLTPANSTIIYSVAIDPKDVSALYYGTSTTFYRTPNGGVNWVPKKLPSSRAATALLVDGVNQAVVYMGLTRFKN